MPTILRKGKTAASSLAKHAAYERDVDRNVKLRLQGLDQDARLGLNAAAEFDQLGLGPIIAAIFRDVARRIAVSVRVSSIRQLQIASNSRQPCSS